MKFDLNSSAKEHILVVSHRGACGGNIPCNTLPAYEAALMQGSDMLETDVTACADGTLFIFHPTMEAHFLHIDKRLHELNAEQVKELRYVNQDGTPTQFGLMTLDEFFETYKNRCYINVDKFWDNPAAISAAIKRHGMQEQVVVKSKLSEKVLSVLEEVAPELAFMPIVTDVFPEHEALMKRNIRYIGAEVLFADDSAEVASKEFIEKMHRDGKLVWVNSIIYRYQKQLSGGHSDDSSICVSPEQGWGWLADRGFDLIQTDWTMMMIDFLKKTGRYYK